MKRKLLGWLWSVGLSALWSGHAHAGELDKCEHDIKETYGPKETEGPTEREKQFNTPEAKAELAKADCELQGVYCVDATGYPLPSESPDPEIKSGQTLIVKLFGPKSCDGILKVGTNVKQSDIRLFRDEAKDKAAPPPPPPPPLIEVQLLAKATVTTGATAEAVTIVVSRADIELSMFGIKLNVTPARYFLDVGLLVSFTPRFQTVSTSRAPGSSEYFIREEHKTRPSAAVTVNYFPFGQYSVPRFTGHHGFGLQAGMGGDLSKLDDEFYLGLIWEPIPGAGVSGGLALMAMERLHPEYPAGALVNPQDVPKDEFLGSRFYFGVCLNTQVFQSVLQLGGKALVPNQ